MGTILALSQFHPLPGMSTLATTARVGAGEYVDTDPNSLADETGYDVDVYSLARMIASEGYDRPGASDLERTVAAVVEAQCIRNKARRRGMSVTTHLTRATGSGNGYYGPQGSTIAGYRDASTAQDPTFFHLVIAQAVTDNEIPDLVNGATDFLDPHVFAGGTQGGIVLSPVDKVLASWSNEDQLTWVGPIPGLDSYYLMAFVKESSSDKRTAMLSAAQFAAHDSTNGPAPGDPDEYNTGTRWLALIGLTLFVFLA